MALKGLAEVIELCRSFDCDLMFPHMTTVNQRLIELLRSSRSHVCRTACQAAGHLFDLVKDTRRPVRTIFVTLNVMRTHTLKITLYDSNEIPKNHFRFDIR